MEIIASTKLSEILDHEKIVDMYSAFKNTILSNCNEKYNVLKTEYNDESSAINTIVNGNTLVYKNDVSTILACYDNIINNIEGDFNTIKDAACTQEYNELTKLRTALYTEISTIQTTITTLNENYKNSSNKEADYDSYYGSNGKVTKKKEYVGNLEGKISEVNIRINKIGSLNNRTLLDSRLSLMNSHTYSDVKSHTDDRGVTYDLYADATHAVKIGEKYEIDGNVVYYYDSTNDTYFDKNGNKISSIDAKALKNASLFNSSNPVDADVENGQWHKAYNDSNLWIMDPSPGDTKSDNVQVYEKDGKKTYLISNGAYVTYYDEDFNRLEYEQGKTLFSSSFEGTFGMESKDLSKYNVISTGNESGGSSNDSDNTNNSESSNDSGPFIPNDMDKYWLDE